MGEFNDTVLALIDAFNSGIALIKSLRRHRREAKRKLDPSVKGEEVRLGKSLRKSKAYVQSRYSRDSTKYGHRFSSGDDEAQSSLTAILLRLNAGFVSIIARFTRGQSTRSDYQTLVNLSNASRIEAVKTFGQLSARLSRSSVVPAVSDSQKPIARTRSTSKKSHSPTPLGVTINKSRRRLPSAPALPPPLSRKMDQADCAPIDHLSNSGEQATTSTISLPISRLDTTKLEAKDSSGRNATESKSPSHREVARLSKPRPKPLKKIENRLSTMSLSSDSTQIGEIPEYRLVRRLGEDFNEHGQAAAFPLAPWKQPEKPRNRFMRLFGR